MELSQALGIINLTAPDRVQSLADLLSPDLIQQAFSLTNTVTLHKRKLPLESMVWLVIGMTIFNNRSLFQIVNLMDTRLDYYFLQQVSSRLPPWIIFHIAQHEDSGMPAVLLQEGRVHFFIRDKVK